MNNAMGKGISTTCCACRASSAAFMSKGFIWSPRLLHYDFGHHFGMDRAEVGVFAWLREGVREMLAGIESLRFEGCFVVANHRVWHIVIIRPGDGGPSGHRHRHRTKAEVIDFDF